MVHKSYVHVRKACHAPLLAPLPEYFRLALEELSLTVPEIEMSNASEVKSQDLDIDVDDSLEARFESVD